jgi:hypothetical protein
MDLDNNRFAGLPEVDSPFLPKVDLNQFKGKLNKIVDIQGLNGELRITSPNAKAADGKVHVLKIIGEIVHTEQTAGKVIEFRPTELINLVEDGQGNLLGLPKNDQSNWQILKGYLNVKTPQEMIGKSLPMTVTKKGYLGYMYR